ncbi:MAG TPA: hypothetical protein VKF36_06725 [Syntrophorhabdales bacterium]|nr:hypothetical protein [Syntrophorhabdales bacterium]
MQAKDYCSGVKIELNRWKAKMYDVVRKLDLAATRDKQKVVPMVNELYVILKEFDDRVERLEKFRTERLTH